ncbi:MAG: sigma-70 family RNA polymerase sigma factor [Pseudomonadota bacterium]
MRAAQSGDKTSYDRLLRELATVIERYLRNRFGPAEFIDDVTQDCLLSIHTGRHTYDPDRPFRAWLFTIVRHRTIDYLRRQRGNWSTADRETDIDGIAAPESLCAVSEAATLLRQLNPQQREIIVLMKYLGFSAEETSERLGISVTGARVRLHRALAATRRLLKADWQDDS